MIQQTDDFWGGEPNVVIPGHLKAWKLGFINCQILTDQAPYCWDASDEPQESEG